MSSNHHRAEQQSRALGAAFACTLVKGKGNCIVRRYRSRRSRSRHPSTSRSSCCCLLSVRMHRPCTLNIFAWLHTPIHLRAGICMHVCVYVHVTCLCALLQRRLAGGNRNDCCVLLAFSIILLTTTTHMHIHAYKCAYVCISPALSYFRCKSQLWWTCIEKIYKRSLLPMHACMCPCVCRYVCVCCLVL